MVTPAEGKTAEGEDIPVTKLGRAMLERWTWKTTGRGKYKTVIAEWSELGAATVHTVTEGDGEPILKLRHCHATEAEATRAAESALSRSLAGVVIECLDYAEFITRYDNSDTLFCLDPPYWGCENDYGKNMFGREEFARMANQLAQINGRFLMSINDVSEIKELFGEFQIEEVSTSYTIGKGNESRAKRTELLISGGGG